MIDKVSSHFRRSEFSCTDGCGFKAVDVQLLELLEKIRDHFGSKPVTITSGCRCLKHNHDIGSLDTSQHVRGIACDFRIKGIEPQLIYDYINDWHDGGLGIYNSWIHLDVRGKRARWDNRHG
jgi:uncharacterized protein YcbK (DUF882 family)